MGIVSFGLVRSDAHGTVLVVGSEPMAYAPYGFREPSSASALGFSGQLLDHSTGRYPLGNGLRMYSPALMRFQSPDSLSPFGKGGLNAYAYCLGDPVNGEDPSGHAPLFGHKLPKLVKTFVKESRKFRSGEREIAPDLLSLPPSKVSRAESVLGREMDTSFDKMSLREARLVAGATSEPELAELIMRSGSPRVMQYGRARDDYRAFIRAVNERPRAAQELPLPEYRRAIGMRRPDADLPTYVDAVRGGTS